MTESTRNPQRDKRAKPAGQTGQKPQPAQPLAPGSRRTLSKKRREERRQRLVITTVGITIGLVVLALVLGVLYDQVWIPSRPLAQVNDTTLTRRDYWQEQRYAYTQEIVQNLQLQALFADNPQLSGQFTGRNPTIDQQISTIRSTPENEQTITAWQDAQLAQQGAAEMEIQVSSDEVNQQLVQDLGGIFLPPPPVTATETLTPTALTATEAITTTVAATAVVTPTQVPTATLTPTVTPGGPTLTPAPTETPAPTDTAPPTPEPGVASEQAPQIIEGIYNQYTTEIELAGQEPQLTPEDFQAALQQQYQRQVYTRKVQEQLVPEASFEPTSEPDRIQARQILLQVDVPEDASEEQRDQAFAERQAEAAELVAQLRNGADFAELAAENSDDPGSKDAGGDLGYFDQDGVADNGATYPPEVVQVALALEGDAISDPIRTQFGWHILQVTDRQVPSEAEQLRTARTEAFNTWLEQLRAEAEVKRFPEPTATVPVPTAESVPTPEPTYLPGPPTPEPTPEPAPTEANGDEPGPALPTLLPDATTTTP